MNNTVPCFIPNRPCIFPLPASLTTSIKKAAGTSHKKVFQMKTSACRDGTLKNQPNKMGTTPQHIYTIPTSCAILPNMHNKKLSTHSLNAHSTQHCLLFSLPHKRRSIPDSATFSSSKILKTPNIPCRPSTAHSFCIQGRLYLPCSTATTSNALLEKSQCFNCYSAVYIRAYIAMFRACCVCSDEDCIIAVETSAFF